MQELKHLVPFGAWVFIWSNSEGQLVNSVTSPFRPETLRYFAEHFDNLARDVGFSVHDAMGTFPDVSNPRRTGRLNPRMDETESFRLVWGPEGAYFNLTLAVRRADGHPLGLIQIFRHRESVDFDPDEESAIGAVMPYLRRLLTREIARAGALPLVQDGLAGVAVFTDRDDVFLSDRAFELAVQAFNDRLPITRSGLQIVDPTQRLREMHDDVVRSCRTDGRSDDCVATSAVRLVSNERGVFAFDWEASLRRGRLIWSVAIRHKIPARLRLLSTPEGALLSDRQLEVCRRLLDGESIPQIAAQIGVKPSTLKDHTREVYRKFGVSDRNELLRKVVDTTPDMG